MLVCQAATSLKPEDSRVETLDGFPPSWDDGCWNHYWGRKNRQHLDQGYSEEADLSRSSQQVRDPHVSILRLDPRVRGS